MGNNNSHKLPTSSVDVVRRPPSRPNAPPSARPLSELGPRGPSYHSPENQVLPKELPSILKLRPVSMELSKYNSDYKELFAHHKGDNLDNNENKIENNGEFDNGLHDFDEQNSTPLLQPSMQNGHIPSKTHTSSVSQLPNANLQTPPKSSSSSNKSAVPYRPSHRRQMSLGQSHVIIEEPEEIDARVKLDPLMQSFPGATGPSLPVKNNFNLDYSYQLTYVQLAEHRRNKTIEELEKRTGKKLSDLSADLNEHTQRPEFIRDASSRVSSRSTRSHGSALSSKKKKAPPPPGQAPPLNPPTSPRHQSYSVDNEPPVDYDMDSPRRPAPASVALPTCSSTGIPPVSRVAPSVSKSPPHPPPPHVSSPRKPHVNLSRNPSMSNGTPEIILKKAPKVKQASKSVDESDAQIPWLLEIKNLSEARAARRQQSEEASEPPEPSQNDAKNSYEVENKEDSKPRLVFESSTEISEIEKESVEKNDETVKTGMTVERSNSLKESPKVPASKLLRHHSTTGYDHPTATQIQRQTEPATSMCADPVRRLSSLLQHDIKSVANAKCIKLVKQTTPVPPKPKDPHTVFREQLQKAAAARDERAKSEGTIDEQLKLNISSASFDFDAEQYEVESEKCNTTPRKEKQQTQWNEGPNTLPKPPRYHKNVSINRNSTSYNRVQKGNSEEKPQRNSQNRQNRSMSFEWTPEDDLESDDNLSDREVMTRRNGSSDGFKSTIIPNAMIDVKGKKKGKSRKQQKEYGQLEEQNKNKFGSVRKLKKSMHKGVKNAFGSISKASGKFMRRQRSEDFEAVDDAPKNWSMIANMNGQSDHSQKYHLPNDYGHDDASDSDSEKYIHDNEFSEIVFRENGNHVSEESDSTYESEDKAPQNIRRAGVAYISAKGKLVLMKDEDEEEMIQNMKSKSKKKKYKDRSFTAEQNSEDIREKERKQEEEKRKQLEMELEMHKRREAETRERLQRLENAHLQQQLYHQQQQQQQQQQQNMGILSAPQLPPAGNFPGYGTLPDTARAQAYTTNILGQQLPQNGYQPNFGLYSQTGSYLNSPVSGRPYDLNDYMRMLGVQTPPTSQQMAFFLNNMTLNSQPFDRKSNPVLLDMFNQQYPNANYYQGMDSSMKKSAFQNWTSTPNISTSTSVANDVPMSDFVASYNGAINTNNDKEEETAKPRNPLYSSDESDGGHSPQKSVACTHVKDYRKVPVRSESGKFMRKYAGENYVTQNNQDTQNISDTNKSFTKIPYNEVIPRQQRSVSPCNSVSTVDSAISATSVTLSTSSSPARSLGVPASPSLGSRSQSSTPGFKTVLDLSTPEGGSMQIISMSGDPVKL